MDTNVLKRLRELKIPFIPCYCKKGFEIKLNDKLSANIYSGSFYFLMIYDQYDTEENEMAISFNGHDVFTTLDSKEFDNYFTVFDDCIPSDKISKYIKKLGENNYLNIIRPILTPNRFWYEFVVLSKGFTSLPKALAYSLRVQYLKRIKQKKLKNYLKNSFFRPRKIGR